MQNNSELKYCKDCKFLRLMNYPGKPIESFCASPQRGRNLVTGEYKPIKCEDARMSSSLFMCGDDAKWFEIVRA